MALPMDEQRILDEMERMLAADDPRLAARLAAFGQPGFGQALRTKRARATLSVMVLVLIAAVAAVFYLMSVLRAPVPAPGQSPTRSSAPAHRVTTQATGRSVSAPPSAPSGASACAGMVTPQRCGGWAPASGQVPGTLAR